MKTPTASLAAAPHIDARGDSGQQPRRRPVDGGYARGEETRGRIVEAAMKVFAAEGFAKASTRRIAAEAGVNPPALQYYFDSKDGLHRACADVIIDHCRASLDPARERARIALEQGSPDDALEAACHFLDALCELSVGTRENATWSEFMNRAQGDDGGPAYRYIKQTVSAPMHGMMAALVGKAIGASPDDDAVKLRALLLTGQTHGLHHHREQALADLGWSDYGGPRLAKIKRVVREQTRAALLAARQPD